MMATIFAFLERRSTLAILLSLLVLAAILHSGTSINGGLYADDYIHASYFQGSKALEEKGLLDGIAVGEFWPLLSQQFSFFDPSVANYQSLKNFGILPWWTSDDALLHFFRPLSTASHYLDYALWPNNSHMMHMVNLVWYLLSIAAIFYCYKRIGLKQSIAATALLLVILDNSVYQIVTWVAARSMLMLMAFGFVAVAAYHQSLQSKKWYGISLLTFTLALLSAEGTIAICAYLGAYMFTLDSRPWLKRIAHMLPFIVIVLIWRAYYQMQGFGAFGVDFYIDPGREPLNFLHAAMYRLPGNFFELFTSIDIASGQIRADIRQGYAWFGVALFLGLGYLLRAPLKEDKKLQFFALASLFALVPGLTIALAPRVMVLPYVGFAVVLAYALQLAVDKVSTGASQYALMFVNSFTVFINVFIAFLLCIFMLYNTADFGNKKILARGNVALGVEDFADRPVVVINSLRPFWMSFIAHELAYRGEDLPASVRVLSSAFFPINVQRLGTNSLLLSSAPAFQLDPAPLMDLSTQAHGHYAYLTQTLLGLVRSANEPWQQGQVFSFPEMRITVMRLHQQKPAEIKIDLLQSIENYRFSYWDMQDESYKTFVLPAKGESRQLDGIFNL